MLKPAGSSRNAKPDLIWRATRFAPTLCASSAASTTRAIAKAPCNANARRRRERSRTRQAASPVGFIVPVADQLRAGGRSPDRRGVHQAALAPQVVDAARQ